jgi:hypothetical protein
MQICTSQMELAQTVIVAHFHKLLYMKPTSLDGIIGEGTWKHIYASNLIVCG